MVLGVRGPHSVGSCCISLVPHKAQNLVSSLYLNPLPEATKEGEEEGGKSLPHACPPRPKDQASRKWPGASVPPRSQSTEAETASLTLQV